MVGMMLHFDLFNEWLRGWLETNAVDLAPTNTQYKMGLAEIPEVNAHIPYGILTPLIKPRAYGSIGVPEAIHDYVFQVLTVGRSAQQAQFWSDIITEVMTGRDAAGTHTFAVPTDPQTQPTNTDPAKAPSGVGTILAGSRMSDSHGAIVKSDDGKLFQIVDTYRLKVEE
jgi:hypothetical protein